MSAGLKAKLVSTFSALSGKQGATGARQTLDQPPVRRQAGFSDRPGRTGRRSLRAGIVSGVIPPQAAACDLATIRHQFFLFLGLLGTRVLDANIASEAWSERSRRARFYGTVGTVHVPGIYLRKLPDRNIWA